MQYGMWAYPWDLVDEGSESVADDLLEMGIDRLYLAANYHTVEAFCPHNPVTKTVFADAGAYFQPQHDYGEIAPVPPSTMGEDDWVATVVDDLEDSALEVNAWVVGCHNSVLGTEHEEYAITTPFGDPLAFGLCPSQPAVRDYLTRLLTEVTGRFSFGDVLLETFHYFHGSGWGWHHDKFHADIGDLGEFLLGLCFCDECRERAAADGVDVDAAQSTCQETIVRLAEGELGSEGSPSKWVADHPTVDAYASVREGTLEEFYQELNETVDADLGSFIGMLGVDTSWMHGMNLERLREHVDFFTVMSYREEAADAVEAYETAAARTDPTPVRAGVLPGHPLIHDGDSVEAHVAELKAAGPDEITFYNYGLLPERNLDWIGKAIAALED
ncbi:MAG: hypothetical protein RI560_07400 [Natronomonas sp.]|uniref:hypothetical protein n=1 Tax=Natronomonas sp. TaxID=2184060 RepID=UPI002870459E|nr:hypothetical protein [Natronomonas sp.]MDR9381481.1 hypothetical protein [Natronomonas sp.]MDR9431949.1 hypothetical protein [Natronomonas sp.]